MNYIIIVCLISQVRDLVNWSSSLRATILTEDKVRDAASAQLLKGEHEAVKAEIEAREQTFQTVADLGEALVQGGHFAANVSYFLIYTWIHFILFY